MSKHEIEDADRSVDGSSSADGDGADSLPTRRRGGQSREATEQALIEAALTLLRERGSWPGSTSARSRRKPR